MPEPSPEQQYPAAPTVPQQPHPVAGLAPHIAGQQQPHPATPRPYAGAVAPLAGGAVTQNTFMAQSAYEDSRKSVGIGYLLWFFFGAFGGHRFYLRQTGSAVAMLILGLTVVGLLVTGIWAIVDAFLIPGMTERLNRDIKRDVFGRHGIIA